MTKLLRPSVRAMDKSVRLRFRGESNKQVGFAGEDKERATEQRGGDNSCR